MTGFYRGLRVVEVGDDAAGYLGRLFTDLGAAVTRLETDPPVPGRLSTHDESTNLFLHRHKHRLSVAHGRAPWEELQPVDLVISSNLTSDEQAMDLHRLTADAVHVRISYFGTDGPLAQWEGSDLVASATGGFLTMAGYPGRPPTRAFGDQSLRMAALHGAVGAALALFDRQRSGRRQVVDVSVQEAVATALENAIQFYDLEDVVRERRGQGYSEAGTGVYACRDGLVYLMAGRLSTSAGWSNLVSWLREEGVPGAEELAADVWSDHDYRATLEADETFRRVFETFASGFDALELYTSCQRRKIVLCPVSSPAQLLDNEHLRARDFFIEEEDRVFPGVPYRCRDGSAVRDGAHADARPAWSTA